MSASEDFDIVSFEEKLEGLKDTQEGIQQMSTWCLSQRKNHKKIVNSWLNVFRKVRVEQRVTLFYLANDVIQQSKRRKYEFVESWFTTLQKATTMVRDDKVRSKIFRIFKIWEERTIYSEEYLNDLKGLLNTNPAKKTQQPSADSSDDYLNTALITNIRDCVRLEKCTDKFFKKLPKAPNCDIETIKNNLKDRSHSDDAEKDIDEYATALDAYIKCLKVEIKSRGSLTDQLVQAETFYASQRAEVKVVANAYRNFGNRIKAVKKKLDEIIPDLPSPIPSPDVNAPSPEQDADIVLPDDQNNISINMFKNSSNGYSSYMDGNLPFDIDDFKRESPQKAYDVSSAGTQAIQVINNRLEQKSVDYNIDDFFKSNVTGRPYTSLDDPQPSPAISNYSLTDSASGRYLNDISGSYSNNSSYSGYDDSTYGTSTNRTYDTQMPLMPPPMPPLLGTTGDDFNSTWDMDMSWTSMNSNNSFNSSVETSVSPPHFEREGVNSNIIEYMERVNDDIVSLQDVDHRQLHIPLKTSVKMPLGKEKGRSMDIDHRNLISLTGSPGSRKFDHNKDNRSKNVSNSFKNNEVQHKADVDLRRIGNTDYKNKKIQEQNKLKRNPFLQEIPIGIGSHLNQILSSDGKSKNLQDVLNEISALKELKPNTGEDKFKEKNENVYEKTESPIPPPPPLPTLDTSIFPDLHGFPSSPSSVYSSSVPPQEPIGRTDDSHSKDHTILMKKRYVKDDVESIDMDMSDEDQEEHNRDRSQKFSIAGSDTFNGAENFINETTTAPTKGNSRPPLLQTPNISSAWMAHSSNMPSGNNPLDSNDINEMPVAWNPATPGPKFRMPGPQQYSPRMPFNQSPRAFNPQMSQNYREPSYHGQRNTPYFNNRGRFSKGRNGARPPRGGFRGSNQWQ